MALTPERMVQELNCYIDDPQWGDHSKIPKAFLRAIISALAAPTPPQSSRDARTFLYDKRDPMEHELKTWIVPFRAIATGRKTFEFRKNDRDFREGDTLWLRETFVGGADYTGEDLRCVITYILKGGEYGVPDGYVVMALKSTPSPTAPTITEAELESLAVKLDELEQIIARSPSRMMDSGSAYKALIPGWSRSVLIRASAALQKVKP